MSRGPGRGVAEAGQRTPSVVTVNRSHEKRFPAAGVGLGWAGLGQAGPVSWRRTAVLSTSPHAAPARQQTLDISTWGQYLHVLFKYSKSMLDIYIFFA